MSSTVEATLKKSSSDVHQIVFKIEAGHQILDFIVIEAKTKGKHKNKAIWSSAEQYKSMPIHQMLNRLSWMGFNTKEFQDACIEMGWGEQVKAWRPADLCAGCGRVAYTDDLDHNGGFCLDCALERYANT